MFIPVGVHSQAIWEVEKTATGEVKKRRAMDVMVSLVTGRLQ